MTTKLTLVAEVNVTPIKGKAKWLSNVLVRSGNLIVATARLAGKYNAEQALAEFRKSPGKFQVAPKFASLTPEQLRVLAA